MKKYYISNMEAESGISKYSKDFYTLILKDLGYKFIRSDFPLNEILSLVTSRDAVHIELGVFQKQETAILFAMLRANYKHVTVTLHDAPLLKYPFHEFSNPLLNIISKIYDRTGQSKARIKEQLEKINRIYVLTKIGASSLQKRFGLKNVYFLPHIINPDEILEGMLISNNLLFFGFVGKNKGVDYALEVHKKLIQHQKQVQFFVIGKPLGRQVEFYENLKKRFTTNVKFLGYVPENQVESIFLQAGFAILPFQNYRFFHPFSGSVLYSLKKGAIVFANPSNCVPELIEDGVNGFYLSGNPETDSKKIKKVMEDPQLQEQIRKNSYKMLKEKHFPNKVLEVFNSNQNEVLSFNSQLQ